MADSDRLDSKAPDAPLGAEGRGAALAAQIEALLLEGLDRYFAHRYDDAIHVWTRVLFLDRSHARARAYIDRARSALAERQRESEELLQNGVAAFKRGEHDEARRLLQSAIERGAPTEEALAVLDRLNRFEPSAPPASLRSDRASREHAPHEPRAASRSIGGPLGIAAIVVAATASVALAGAAAWNDTAAWRSIAAFAKVAARSDPPSAPVSPPVARDAPLPLPRRGETALLRAQALTAGGHLHDALSELDAVRLTDPEWEDADHLRADIQRQLLALTPVPYGGAPDREKGDRRNR